MTRASEESARRVAEAVALGKRQILDDMLSGLVPRDVGDFGRLHDFTDANEHGGLCDGTWPIAVDDDVLRDALAVQEELHQWLVEMAR